MKKTTLTLGLLSGAINALWLIIFVATFDGKIDYDKSELIGYASMLLSFSFIFFGIKTRRDKYEDGSITFGKAFKTGALIALISSTIYVAVWLVEYFYFIPDFGKLYGQHMMEQAQASGLSPEELLKKKEEMKGFVELYNNPFFNILMTYTEILPVGLLVSLICSLILKRKKVVTA